MGEVRLSTFCPGHQGLPGRVCQYATPAGGLDGQFRSWRGGAFLRAVALVIVRVGAAGSVASPLGALSTSFGTGVAAGRQPIAIGSAHAYLVATFGDPPRAEDAELVLSAPRGEAADQGDA
jgi:hypothetical protein